MNQILFRNFDRILMMIMVHASCKLAHAASPRLTHAIYGSLVAGNEACLAHDGGAEQGPRHQQPAH